MGSGEQGQSRARDSVTLRSLKPLTLASREPWKRRGQQSRVQSICGLTKRG